MQEFIKADIFFYVTTIAVILITILLSVALIYAIVILKNTKKFINEVKKEGEELIDDIKDFRVKLRTKGGIMKKLPALFTFVRKVSDIGKKQGDKDN